MAQQSAQIKAVARCDDVGEMLKRCRDCGCFVSRDHWIEKGRKNNTQPLCVSCFGEYDDPQFM